MKLKKYYTIFAIFVLLLVSACALSSSKGGANLILYAINERTEDLSEEIGTRLYTVSEVDGEPNKIYEVDTPQQIIAWYSQDGSKVILLAWEQVERPGTIVPGGSFTLVTMDPDGENLVTWYKEAGTKTIAYFGLGSITQFSKDGKRFLYTRPASEENTDYELFTAKSDGSDKQLIDQGRIITAEFTPKGDKLLVTRRIEDNTNKKTIYEIYYVDAKGGDPEVVWSSEEKGVISVYAKMVDDDQVLLAVGSFSTEEVELFMASGDFDEITPLTQFPETSVQMVNFSRDGKYIALGRRGDSCSMFSVIEVDSGEIHDVSCWFSTPYQFSSNGKYLLVTALGEYEDFKLPGTNTMLLEPDGDLIENLEYPEYVRVTLSPEGDRLAYWSRDPDTKETCMKLRDLESDDVTTLDATCIDGATDFPGMMEWK